MRFELSKASDWNFKELVNIETMDDLKALAKKYYDSEKGMMAEEYATLVIYFDPNFEMPVIQIYDDYIE